MITNLEENYLENKLHKIFNLLQIVCKLSLGTPTSLPLFHHVSVKKQQVIISSHFLIVAQIQLLNQKKRH
jgi:hypothetical protein